MFRTVVALASLCLGLAPLPALAEDAAGDWLGSLKTPRGDLRLAVHLARAGGGFEGTVDSIDQEIRGLKVAAVAATADTLAFTVPTVQAAYQGRWDPSLGRWVGSWTQGGGSLPLELARGSIPPPVVTPSPAIAGLDGDWEGAVDTPNGRLRLVVHVATTAALGTKATLDVPDQGISGLPLVALGRDGAKVHWEQKGTGSVYDGALDPSGKTISGDWSQAGQSAPVTLTRK